MPAELTGNGLSARLDLGRSGSLACGLRLARVTVVEELPSGAGRRGVKDLEDALGGVGLALTGEKEGGEGEAWQVQRCLKHKREIRMSSKGAPSSSVGRRSGGLTMTLPTMIRLTEIF